MSSQGINLRLYIIFVKDIMICNPWFSMVWIIKIFIRYTYVQGLILIVMINTEHVEMYLLHMSGGDNGSVIVLTNDNLSINLRGLFYNCVCFLNATCNKTYACCKKLIVNISMLNVLTFIMLGHYMMMRMFFFSTSFWNENQQCIMHYRMYWGIDN